MGSDKSSDYSKQLNREEHTEVKKFPKSEEQRQRITVSLRKIFLFRCLDDEQKKQTLDALIPRPVKANEIVIKQGDEGDYFYVIESGTFEASISDAFGESKIVKRYENYGCFGELALMYNELRAATVKAVTEGFLWALNGYNFRRLILRNAYKKRKHYESLLQTINQLKPLSAYEKNIVSDALIPKEYKNGEIIFCQGDTADGIYFVESGEVSVTIKRKEDVRELCRLGPGKCFGELALVTKKPRAATITAVGQTKVGFLDVNAFENLLGPHMSTLEKEVAETYKQPSTSTSSYMGSVSD